MAEPELIRGSGSPYQADLKFLSGENYRLVPTTSKLLEKFASMEAKMDVHFTEIQKTLSQLYNQLGIHPIEADSSQHAPPVTNFSDPYVHDDVNRLSLDNRKNLSHKIEMPKFDGSNAYEWLSKVERFFRDGRYSDCDKLDLVSLSLEGDVLKWFNWQLIRREFRSWEDFRRRLFRKFGAAPEQSPRNRLFALKQTGTVSAYVPIDKFSNQQVDEISGEKKGESHEATLVKVLDNLEEASVTQNQVPVSSLEPSLSFSSEPLDVSASWPCAIVSNNPVQSQAGFESVKSMNNAHHVFDELLLRQHKFQHRKKPSLSPKSRMFKFKNRTMLINWSQMDLHQVIDISKVTNLSPCFSADFGLVRKKRPFQCLRLKNLRLNKQAHMSRFLYQLRMLQDPRGMKQLLHGDMKSWFVCDRESGQHFRVMAVQPKRQVGLDKVELPLDQRDITLVGLKVEIASLLEVNCVLAECMMHKATVISAKLYSLFSFEVDTEANMSSGLSQTSQVWEPGGVLADHVLVDWFMDFIGSDGIVAGIRCLGIGVCSGINQPIDSRRVSRVWERGGLNISAGLTDWLMKCYKGFEFSRLMRKLPKIDLQWVRRKDWAELCVGHGLLVSWCGWMVFDRGKNKLILRDVPSEVIEALAKHCPQLTDLGFLDCLNHAMRGSNTSSHNLVHLMWQLKSQTLILLSLRILLHRFIVCGISRPLGCFHRSLSPISYSQA